jgi:hypothetical protein
MVIGTEGFKLLRGYFTSQSKLFSSKSDPFTRNPLTLGIVVIGPEMILQVSLPTVNLGSRKHRILDMIPYSA